MPNSCWERYGEVVGRAYGQPAEMGRWHQTCVDAYGAQHTGAMTPAITTAFALIGLYLVLERGLAGYQVREAHSYLAQRGLSWPRYDRPPAAGKVTIVDVHGAATAAHGELVLRWGSSVWTAWEHTHEAIRTVSDRELAACNPAG
jgi:hypothetical protein